MKLKKIIKLLNKNESTISMILGVIVILIVGLFIIKNSNPKDEGQIIPSIGTEEEQGLENTYTVQSGDDLWKIAEKFLKSGYEWKKIADANNLTAPYKIDEGQKLIIPSTVTVEVTSTPEVSPTSIPTATVEPSQEPTKFAINPTNTPTITPQTDISEKPSISGDTYEVVAGDNLWNIAVRSYGDGFKWVEIAKANNLKNPGIIHPGNKFVIPR